MLTVKVNQPKIHDQLGSSPWKHVRAGNKTPGNANVREIERTVKAGIMIPHAARAAQIIRKSQPSRIRK